ncbi:hypothetical protein QTP86_015093, partial [Hemibagrus guttatus]
MGVHSSLLVKGVEVILGNNLSTKMMNDEDVDLCDTCVPVKSVTSGLSLLSKISRAEHVVAQRDDPGLKSLFAVVLPPEDVVPRLDT